MDGEVVGGGGERSGTGLMGTVVDPGEGVPGVLGASVLAGVGWSLGGGKTLGVGRK